MTEKYQKYLQYPPERYIQPLENGQQNEECLNLQKGKQAKPLKKAAGEIPLAESHPVKAAKASLRSKEESTTDQKTIIITDLV